MSKRQRGLCERYGCRLPADARVTYHARVEFVCRVHWAKWYQDVRRPDQEG